MNRKNKNIWKTDEEIGCIDIYIIKEKNKKKHLKFPWSWQVLFIFN